MPSDPGHKAARIIVVVDREEAGLVRHFQEETERDVADGGNN